MGPALSIVPLVVLTIHLWDHLVCPLSRASIIIMMGNVSTLAQTQLIQVLTFVFLASTTA